MDRVIRKPQGDRSPTGPCSTQMAVVIGTLSMRMQEESHLDSLERPEKGLTY